MPKTLSLFAHPDDEFACSARILEARRRGWEVHCAYLTNGGHGGQSVSRRIKESTQALQLIGVNPSTVHFIGEAHGIPDGFLHLHMDRAAEGLEEVFVKAERFDSVHVPAWEGGHQDHDATHLIGSVVALRREVPVLRQFPLYNGSGLRGPFFRVLSPLAANGPIDDYRAHAKERWLALRVCLVHRSQWKSWAGLLPFFALKMLLHGRFPMQPVDVVRWRDLPHSGSLLYERRGALRAGDFLACSDKFLSKGFKDWKGRSRPQN